MCNSDLDSTRPPGSDADRYDVSSHESFSSGPRRIRDKASAAGRVRRRGRSVCCGDPGRQWDAPCEVDRARSRHRDRCNDNPAGTGTNPTRRGPRPPASGCPRAGTQGGRPDLPALSPARTGIVVAFSVPDGNGPRKAWRATPILHPPLDAPGQPEPPLDRIACNDGRIRHRQSRTLKGAGG